MRLSFDRSRSQRGNALLEAGLVTPVMILLLSGVIDFGRSFYYTDVAASAARAGAQYGIQAASNFKNFTRMKVAAFNDANATCKNANNNNSTVTCGDASQTDAYIGPNLKFSVTADSYCKDSTGSKANCPTSANPSTARGFVEVHTTIAYGMLIPWPGLPTGACPTTESTACIQIAGAAIMRTK